MEGCIWCGSRGHDVLNCLGYATWLGDIWLGPVEERRLDYIRRMKWTEQKLKTAKDHYNVRRPWELYTGLDDGEYLTTKGVKILIQDKKDSQHSSKTSTDTNNNLSRPTYSK